MNIINSTVSSNPYSEIFASASTQLAGRSLIDLVFELRSLALNAAEEGKSCNTLGAGFGLAGMLGSPVFAS